MSAEALQEVLLRHKAADLIFLMFKGSFFRVKVKFLSRREILFQNA